MLLKFLYFILLLAAFRFLVRLVRAVLAVSGSRPEVRSKRAPASGLDKLRYGSIESRVWRAAAW